MSVSSLVLANKLELIAARPAVELYADGALKPIVEEIETFARSITADISTPKGRQELISLAAKISSTKVFLDETGKELGEEARLKVNRINEDRKFVRDRLESLRDEVRKPVTDFENAEKERIKNRDAVYDTIITSTDGIEGLEPHLIESRITFLTEIDTETLDELAGKAEIKRGIALTKLRAALTAAEARIEAAKKAEADRLAEEERQRVAREKKIADDAAAKATADAEAKARAEADNERKRAEAEAAKAKADSDALIAAEKARADQVKRDADAAIEAEKARVRWEKEEEDKRAADEAHRSKILSEVADDIREVLNGNGLYVAEAIAAGKIRHVSIKF